jgi:hypothetical protein
MVDASNRASGVVFDAAVYISEAMHVLRVVIVTFARDAPRLPGHHFNERVSDEIIQHHEAMFFCNNAQRRPGRPLSMPGKTDGRMERDIGPHRCPALVVEAAHPEKLSARGWPLCRAAVERRARCQSLGRAPPPPASRIAAGRAGDTVPVSGVRARSSSAPSRDADARVRHPSRRPRAWSWSWWVLAAPAVRPRYSCTDVQPCGPQQLPARHETQSKLFPSRSRS